MTEKKDKRIFLLWQQDKQRGNCLVCATTSERKLRVALEGQIKAGKMTFAQLNGIEPDIIGTNAEQVRHLRELWPNMSRDGINFRLRMGYIQSVEDGEIL